jgi:membrane-associated protein
MIELIVKYGPTIGYLMIFAIIFAESGLLIGFFLPGDSLLFTAGVLASPASQAFLQVHGVDTQSTFFSLPILLVGCFIAAVVGDSVGYTFGKRVGPRIFQREDSLLFNKKNIYRAQEFYERHGGKAIILARFVPIVRTFAPIIAGVGDMKYNRFLSFNLIGGFLWAVGVSIAGFIAGTKLGESVKPEEIDKILLPVIVAIVLISVAPAAYHILKEKENREALRNNLMKLLGRSSTVAAE